MKTFLILIVCLGLAAGAGGYYWHAHAGPTVTFRTQEVTRGEMVPTISATGTVEPQDVVDVGAQVVGQIISFGKDANGKPVDYRSPVDAGMVLAKIDPTIYNAEEQTARASLAQANASVDAAVANRDQMKARLEEAQGNWERAKPLIGTEALSATDAADKEATYKTALANLAAAEAAIVTAKATVIQNKALVDKAVNNVGYCTINSPVKGVIIDRRVNVGQTVVSSLSSPSLFLIAKDLTQIQVWVSVNEADIGKVYPGQPVTFTVGAYSGQTFKGTVGKVRLNATMTQNVVTYTVEVNTENKDSRLLPYMTANVQFEVSREKDVLMVPNAALRWFPQPEMVAPDVREAYANKGKGEQEADTAPAPAATPGRQRASGPTSRPTHVAPRGHGTVWVTDGRYVRQVKVRTGATDGVNTEVFLKDDELKEGTKLVIGEVRSQASDDATTNPFAPKPIWGGKKH